MDPSLEEFKAKIDGALSEEKFIQRSIDSLSRLVHEEPYRVLRFLREHPELYVLIPYKEGLFASLKSRMDERIKKQEEEIREAMETTVVTQGEKVETARLKPIRKTPQFKLDIGEVMENISSCHIILGRTERMLPLSDNSALLHQTVLDLEKVYASLQEFSKKPRTP